ncbi:MAG: hypothetical protein HEP71_21175 [Roseivirga sp.]|nr:hypothetical protein [Roseivirga sp.]
MGLKLRTTTFRKKIWSIYFMELMIVILGISIAFQVQVIYEDNQNAKRELIALERFHSENELNLREFESLMPYRINMEQNTRILHLILDSPFATNRDSIANYVFTLQRISTPDLPTEAMNGYLNGNYDQRNLELEREMQALKALYAELQELTSHYWEKKTTYFYNPIKSEVDFSKKAVISTDKLTSLSFRNDLWSLFLDEIEQNRLYKESYDKLIDVQSLTEEALSSRQ